MESTANEYDAVEYPSYSFLDTHPDRMSVMAALHGLSAAPVSECRVLEVACGEGSNLIPMAYAMPGAEFTGFDLAGLPIGRGQQQIRELGLGNIRLFQADLRTVEDLGEYDYIIAHGLYSWVPAEARDGLMALCARHLAGNGIAFISFNALPGSHVRNILRDALHWASRPDQAPEERVSAGIRLLSHAARSHATADPFRLMLEELLGKVTRRSAGSTWHDEFAPNYQPFTIVQFMEDARRHGLDFLSEATLRPPVDPSFQPDVMEAVAEIAGGDRIAKEYTLDFYRMRMFWQPLLVRAGVVIHPEGTTAAIPSMRFSSAAKRAAPEREGSETFQLQGGTKVNTDQAPVIALLERLIDAWPRTLSYSEVLPILTGRGVPAQHAPALLGQMATARFLDLHTWEPAVSNKLSERPMASAYSRHHVRAHPYVANLWHRNVRFEDPVVRAMLSSMDGTRNRDGLRAELERQFPEMNRKELAEGIESNLEHFRYAALLEA